MRAQKRRYQVLTLALSGMLFVGACGGDDDDSAAANGGGEVDPNGRFSMQISEPQHGLIPGDTNETSGAEVLDAVFAGLVDYDPKTSEPENKIAESIETKNNRVWTVKIKPGYTFHNGEKVTASSFVDAWNYSAATKNALQNRAFFARIAGFENVGGDKATGTKLSGLKVVNDNEFTITLSQPFSQLPVVLGYTAFYPLPKVFYDDPKAFGEAPIGNGPYKMNGSWTHNQLIKVDRYDDFAGDKAKNGGIDFKIYASLETAYNDLRSGNLDSTDALPPSALAGAAAELGSRYVNQPSSVLQYIGFPTFNKKYTADFRKAVSMSIDRPSIAKTIFNDTRIPATSFVAPIVDGARTDVCDFCVYDPEEAKRLFEKSNWSGTLTLAYNADGGHKEWIEASANQVRQNLGIEVEVKPYPSFDQVLDDLEEKRLDGAFRMAWSFDYPSIENYLTPIFGTEAIRTGSNFAGYTNKEFDDLLAKADVAKTAAEGIKQYQAAEDLLFEDMPYLPMFFSNLTGAYSERLQNVTFDAFTRIDKVNVEVLS